MVCGCASIKVVAHSCVLQMFHSLLTQEGIKEYQQLWDKVVVDSRVTWKGDEYRYTDVCTPISSQDPGCRVSAVCKV